MGARAAADPSPSHGAPPPQAPRPDAGGRTLKSRRGHLRDSSLTARPELLTRCADVVRVGIFCGAVAFLAAGDGSAALKALLVMPAAIAPRLIRVHPLVDLIFALALAAEAIGRGVATYGGADVVSHIALPLLSGPVLYVGLVRLGALPAASTAPRLVAAALGTAAAVLALGAAWELVEWAADSALGTNYSQGYRDTLTDLLNDAIAAAASGTLVALWLRAATGRPGLQLAMLPGGRVPCPPHYERA